MQILKVYYNSLRPEIQIERNTSMMILVFSVFSVLFVAGLYGVYLANRNLIVNSFDEQDDIGCGDGL